MKVFSLSAGLVFAVSALLPTLQAEPELVPLTPVATPPSVASGAATPASILNNPATITQSMPAITGKTQQPLAGAELSKFLPEPPPEWTVNEKSSDDQPIEKAPASTARRFYALKTDPETNLAGVEIIINDWVNRPTFLRSELMRWRLSQDPPDESGYIHGAIVKGFPVEDVWSAEDKQHTLTMLLGGRYIMVITTFGLPKDRIAAWLDLVDLKKLSEARP